MQKSFAAIGRIEWIDVHVHLIGGRGPFQDYEGAVQAAVAAMDEAGIKKVVVMPPPQVSGSPLPYDYDSFVSAIRKYPGRFAFLGGGGTLNPMLQEAGSTPNVSDAFMHKFEETANAIITHGAAGFGEITAHHLSHMEGHPYESVPADHPLLLMLADIAVRHDRVIDFHFDLVTEDTPLPERLTSPLNPAVLNANLPAFERLLAHNRKAKIVWAHAGSDPIGHWTAQLSRELLQRHPNLYMSLRLGGGVPENMVLSLAGEIAPQWLALFRDFPDRFVIGGDQFIVSPNVRGIGPGIVFSSRAPIIRQRTQKFLSLLPDDLAQKIGYQNAESLYGKYVSAPPLSLTISTNGSHFIPEDALQVVLTLKNPSTEIIVDGYISVILPNGQEFYLNSGFTWQSNKEPMARVIPIPANFEIFNYPLLSYTFTGDEPEGNYILKAWLTKPGNSEVMGENSVSEFNFMKSH